MSQALTIPGQDEQLIAFREQLIKEYGEEGYRALLGSSAVFKRTYRRDPVAMVHDCFAWRKDEQPTKYQDDILGMLGEGGKTCVQSLHGVGKTALTSWVILWYALTRDGDDWKLVATASAWRQLKFYLFPEVRKWARRLIWGKVGRQPFNERTELQRINLSLSTGEALAAASDNPGLIEGAHADKMAYCFDEAKLIPAATFDAAEGAFSGAGAQPGLEAMALACSTPGAPAGRFYDICRKAPGLETWKVRKITIDEAIRAKRVAKDYPEQMGRLWGTGSALYKNKVLGDFAADDETSVVPLAWIEAANQRYYDYCKLSETGLATPDIDPALLPALRAVGGDVADGGEAKNVVARLYGETTGDCVIVIQERDAFTSPARVQTAVTEAIKRYLDAGKAAGLDVVGVVDANGVGAGVYSALYTDKADYNVVAFMGSEGTEVTDSSGKIGFRNLRALAYWNCRELLNPERTGGAKLALPTIPELTGDLNAPKWKEVAGAQILLESKKDIAKRIGRSTDYGDAVTMALLYTTLQRKRLKAW